MSLRCDKCSRSPRAASSPEVHSAFLARVSCGSTFQQLCTGSFSVLSAWPVHLRNGLHAGSQLSRSGRFHLTLMKAYTWLVCTKFPGKARVVVAGRPACLWTQRGMCAVANTCAQALCDGSFQVSWQMRGMWIPRLQVKVTLSSVAGGHTVVRSTCGPRDMSWPAAGITRPFTVAVTVAVAACCVTCLLAARLSISRIVSRMPILLGMLSARAAAPTFGSGPGCSRWSWFALDASLWLASIT